MAETTTIARPYAQAIFSLATEQGDLAGWSEMLAFAAAVAGDAEMAALIDSPTLGRDEVARIFIEVCGERLNDSGRNLIQVLAENDRLPLFPEIAALYALARAEAERTIEAEVITATPISDAQKEKLAAALQRRLGRNVTLDCRVDKRMMGGAVIRAGDLVIDGSVTGKLQQLRSALMH